MDTVADGTGNPLQPLSGQLSPGDVTMDLTMCGLLVERAEELAHLYSEHSNWNDVKQIWFDERLSNRSTRNSSQKIYSVLTSRLKNAPESLPNPGDLPKILDDCNTSRDKAQVLYPYLIADDALVQYVVHEYVIQLSNDNWSTIDFSNERLLAILNSLKYSDGSGFDYAKSTTERWCEGFRSVMREIGVIDNQREVRGQSPPLGDTPLLVAAGFSHQVGGDDWYESPVGLCYLFQSEGKWPELYDRVASTNAWEYVELHGELQLRPTDGSYGWIDDGGEI